MYAPSTLLFLAAAVSVNALARRDASQGWAVLASSAPSDSVACGGGAYCPSSLTCFDAKNSEVASCCPGNSPCVGMIEGNPSCADSANNLFSGIDGNGFCCMPGQVGVIDRSSRTMNCVASDAVGSSSTAVLTKSGTGAAATPAPSAASSSSSASASSTSSASASTTTDSTSSASASSSSMSSASSASSVSSVSSVSSSSSSASSASSASSVSSSLLAQPTAGSSNGTATSSDSTSINTSTAGAGSQQAAMGLVAAGLMLVAAM